MIFSRRNKGNGTHDKAIEVMYDLHAPWLFAICLRYTGNREDAEDVLQDGFIKIILAYKKFKPGGSLEAWMRRIIVNTALNHIRDHEKEKLFSELEPALEVVPDAEAFEGCDLTQNQLLELVSSLPAGYRMVFNLYVMEDYSHREIAEMLGISENTSRSQLLKARNLLRKRLNVYQNEKKYTERAASS